METSIKTRISEDLKVSATSVLNDCGLTVSGAIRLFLQQVVNDKGLPFDVKTRPSAKTAEAINEAREIIKSRSARFESVDAMLKDLNDGKQTN
ncbi:type II toxin-antitoxin system RelB/DinJ family antitoxin [Salmonella enterica subsp. enterica serovar Enteritidis]|nr:type II toxin-antitoxin system RelB/DinJ family antitoxin [Salmonella enterica subsp. enterica serovar Enteritidis]ECC9066997.1 type II toxin-antitoxin system antitoxin, RelB/DinJ family [Salmonella enterica subsp. diarizonae]ECY5112808.1 type II toxin-antitoxin system RelB/DinJ family antitoxin [Salmonella enterica subsp. enterica serovar Typhimurium]EDJ8220458.1 type II toxin-antitoxin system antitoxin, RelB/DinJ family [Salmonella enterica]EEM3073585.1 type II toxin-antitoxin system RelB/